MKSRVVSGFDYRAQCKRELPLSAWYEELRTVRAAGGRQRRVAGDLTAFDRCGRIIFEIWDKNEEQRA